MATVVGNPMHLLYKLIELDFDAIEAYEAAIERLDDGIARNALTGFKADHERHVLDLSAAVRGMGFDPPERGDFRRVLTRGKVVLANIAGDRGILSAMKGNESDTVHAYAQAAQREELVPEVRALLDKSLADERRHRAWIEQRIEVLRASRTAGSRKPAGQH